MSVLSKIEESTGAGLREWRTVMAERRVLAVTPAVPYAKRLLDVLELIGGDLRVQTATTVPPHPFGDDVAKFLDDSGSLVLPWRHARRTRFDLALAAGARGVARLRSPLVTMPHGANYLKMIKDPVHPGVAGQRRTDLLPDGRPLPAAIVVPHKQDLDELSRSCPEAMDVARVVGDPVHDRIVLSLPQRARFRRALGLRKGQKLVVVCSTWGTWSNFNRLESLMPRVVSELPREKYRIAALLHPNVWNGHGPWQVKSWLRPWSRRGVALVPPAADWRSVLVAADAVIGDFGSVTLYATLTGRPILLSGRCTPELNPASPAAQLARVAPLVSHACSLSEQLDYAHAEYQPVEHAAIAARITSEPGRFAHNMRALLYEQLDLSQPAHPASTMPLPVPPRLDTWTWGNGQW